MPLMEIFADWSLTTVYILCAAAGGTVLIIQTLLLLMGVGDADVDIDTDVDAAFSFLSLRAVVAFITFFGLSGWWGSAKGWSNLKILSVAVASGLAIMLAVAWLLTIQTKLQSKGNLNLANAVGKTASVYLRIPGKSSGHGKITVKVQSRSVELKAFTKGEEIPTGSTVRVLSQATPDTFEVVPLSEE